MGQIQSLDFCCTSRKNNEATVKDIACAKAAAAEARDNAKAECLMPVTDENTFSPIKEALPFESVHELLVGPRKATTTPLTGSPDSVGGDTFKGLPPGNYDDMSEEDKVEAFRACVPSRSLEEPPCNTATLPNSTRGDAASPLRARRRNRARTRARSSPTLNGLVR